MEKSILKYLAGFADRVHAYGNSLSVSSLFADGDAGKLNIYEDYSWLESFGEAVKLIQALFAHMHIHVKHLKELRRLETANRVDSEAFNMTMREPKLWTCTRGKVAPELVYHNAFEDDYAIYENRFIKLLIDEMARYLAGTLNELSMSFGDLNSYLNSGPTAAGELGEGGHDENVLASADEKTIAVYESIEAMLKRVNRLKYSKLYTECDKLPPLTGTVQATNIIVHDEYYRGCYLFYRALRRMLLIDSDAGGTLFNNVFLRLLYAMHRCGYRPLNGGALPKSGGRYGCSNLVMAKGDYFIRLDTYDSDEIGLAVYMNRTDANNVIMPEYISYVALKVAEYMPDIAEEQVALYRKEKIAGGFDEAFVLVLSHYPAKVDGIVNVVNKGEFYSRGVRDFVNSLTVMLKGSHRVYSKRCPVCGSRFVMKSDHAVECGQCGGRWSFVKINGIEKIWLKRIRHK